MLRDLRHHPRRVLIAVLLALTAVAPGCGGSDRTGGPAASEATRGAPARPSSPATLEILSPLPGTTVRGPLEVRVRVRGARVVPPSQGQALRPDRGHLHVVLDGVEIDQMFFSTTARLGAVAPGTHTLSVELVATDHLPFANRPRADVVFRVG